MRAALEEVVRARLRGPVRRAQFKLEPVRRRVQGTLSLEELRGRLDELGVVPGATVMVHVSMNDVGNAAPDVNAGALTALLKEMLGPDGTLLVPTFPFSGLEIDYAREHRSFDRRRTPSKMGLMTEVFRRTPGTYRSLHPTHPVAGWGRHAEELLADHHQGRNSFDEHSPFWRMREQNGIVLGLGVRLWSGFTVLHSAEAMHPPAHAYAFDTEPIRMTVTDGERSFDYDLHPLRGGLDRDIRRTERDLHRAGVIRTIRPAGLRLSVARADELIAGCIRLMNEGTFYRSGPLARGGTA